MQYFSLIGKIAMCFLAIPLLIFMGLMVYLTATTGEVIVKNTTHIISLIIAGMWTSTFIAILIAVITSLCGKSIYKNL